MDKPIEFTNRGQEEIPPPPENPTAVICHTCSYFLATSWNDKRVRGECRRNAPTIDKSPKGVARGVWPVIHGDDTCGEHPARSAELHYRLAKYVAVRSQEEASDIVAPGQGL